MMGIKSWWIRFFLLSPIVAFAFYLNSDPLRKSKCEWYLVPYPEGNETMKVGMVSVCASNFELGRRRCFIAIKPELAEEFNGIPFRYDDAEFAEGFPEEIIKLQKC